MFDVLPFRANALRSRASPSFSRGIPIAVKQEFERAASDGTEALQMGGTTMRKLLLATGLGMMAALAAGSAAANDELNRMSQNPAEWTMPTGDYANTRYSKLKQINASNVGKLQVAWTFSTGVLRGHEGGPLIIGNT